jgi:hypothetical protein
MSFEELLLGFDKRHGFWLQPSADSKRLANSRNPQNGNEVSQNHVLFDLGPDTCRIGTLRVRSCGAIELGPEAEVTLDCN